MMAVNKTAGNVFFHLFLLKKRWMKEQRTSTGKSNKETWRNASKKLISKDLLEESLNSSSFTETEGGKATQRIQHALL